MPSLLVLNVHGSSALAMVKFIKNSNKKAIRLYMMID
jgi:hypothetical protein